MAALSVCGVFMASRSPAALAEPVDQTLGRDVALRFAQAEHARRISRADAKAMGQVAPTAAGVNALKDSAGETLAYVTILNPTGFVVTSSDTEIRPVIAVSLTGTFSFDESSENTLLHMVRTDMTQRLAGRARMPAQHLQRHRDAWTSALAASQTSSTKDYAAAGQTWGPWVTTQWDSVSPYNAYCPVPPRSRQHSDVGCVAVAMGQIINYWKHPSSVTFTQQDSYTTYTLGMFISAPGASIASIQYTNISTDMIARLLYACGVSVQMDYGTARIGGSGAYVEDVASALRNKWRYGSATVECCDPSYEVTDPNWQVPSNVFYDDLMQNMQQAHPAELGIDLPEGGHALVCDGYRASDGMYHLNFGWSGADNAWYSLPGGVDVPDMGYSVVKLAVLNIGTTATTPAGPVAPVIAGISSRIILADEPYTESPTLTHGTPPITWSLLLSPQGMTVDPDTGTVTWLNPITTGSPYTVTLQATNSAGSAEESWTLTVVQGSGSPNLPVTPSPTPSPSTPSPPASWCGLGIFPVVLACLGAMLIRVGVRTGNRHRGSRRK
jgi:hypothetical protein